MFESYVTEAKLRENLRNSSQKVKVITLNLPKEE